MTIGSNRLPLTIAQRLRVPLIAAPMLRVSGPRLVIETCRAGAIGAFPTLNPSLCSPPEQLDRWLGTIQRELADTPNSAPMCPNLIMRNPDLTAHVDSVIRHGAEIVITSVGSPAPILPRLQDAGITVLADVATLEHARKAIDSGVDGLILLTAGAGGQTGWLNAFAYVRAVRRMFDGIIVLAGGITDGVSLRAAEVLGCDLAYMGTKFIATTESLASDGYRDNLVRGSMDEIVLTKAFNGLWGSFMRSSIVA
jgi:nitronate monooxygenase